MLLIRLFWEFFKIGLFAIGGGMATLPFLYELSAKTGWFTAQEVADMIAVSESTPGAIGINMATYVGYTTSGPAGALVATLGEIAPGIIIVCVVATFLSRFHENRYVNAAFYGLRPCSTGLIAAAGISILQISLFRMELYRASGKLMDVFHWPGLLLAVILWILTNLVGRTKKLHPVVFLGASAVIGIVFSFGTGYL